jgi:hypothetical protein
MIKNKCFCGLKRCNNHRQSKTPFYGKWWHIRARCLFKWDKDYKNYGARGIKFEWASYQDFQKDMYAGYVKHIKKYGEKQTTIERINNNGNYCKKNCRWATRQEQLENFRNNRRIILNGKNKTLSQWAKIAKISHQALSYRLNNGLDLKKAMTLKINHGNKYKSL